MRQNKFHPAAAHYIVPCMYGIRKENSPSTIRSLVGRSQERDRFITQLMIRGGAAGVLVALGFASWMLQWFAKDLALTKAR